MAIDIQVPRLAESISEAVLVEWLKEDGAAVRVDEPIATLETDKAAVEIAASESGVLRHARKPGDRVVVGDVIARIEPGAAPVAAPSAGEPAAAKAGGAAASKGGAVGAKAAMTTVSKPGDATAAAPARTETGTSFPRESRMVPAGDGERAPSEATARASSAAPAPAEPHLSPAVRRLVDDLVCLARCPTQPAPRPPFSRRTCSVTSSAARMRPGPRLWRGPRPERLARVLPPLPLRRPHRYPRARTSRSSP